MVFEGKDKQKRAFNRYSERLCFFSVPYDRSKTFSLVVAASQRIAIQQRGIGHI